MSRITPLDIRKKTFSKNPFLGNGYSKDDVDNFLQVLSDDFYETNALNSKLTTELSVTKAELERMRSLESELLQGLKDAKQVSQQLLSQSRKEAYLIVQEAQIKANQLLMEAKHQAQAMLQEANQQAYQALVTMRTELKQLDQDYRVLEKQRDNLLHEFRQFMSDTMHKIEKVEATRRTTTYLDEIAKANELMKRNNESVKNYAQTVPTNENLRKTAVEPPKNSNTSFFDTI